MLVVVLDQAVVERLNKELNSFAITTRTAYLFSYDDSLVSLSIMNMTAYEAD